MTQKKNKIDGRLIIPEVVRMAYWIVDYPYLQQLRKIIKELSDLGFMVKTDEIIHTLKDMQMHENNEYVQEMICITLVAIKLISGKYLQDEIDSCKPIPICEKRNKDRCSMYCDGYDENCESYTSSDDIIIGTCSRFEE